LQLQVKVFFSLFNLLIDFFVLCEVLLYKKPKKRIFNKTKLKAKKKEEKQEFAAGRIYLVTGRI
jgi:hypothetical protein